VNHRKSIDAALAKKILREMPAGELHDTFEYMLAHAATLTSYECGATQKGYLTDFRYYTAAEHPYAFIINKDSLRFYFRKPAGLRSTAANVDVLKYHFDQVEETSSGEIAVQIRTLAEAMALVHGVFGPGFRRYDDSPPLLTYAQLRVVASDMAATYLHGTDDAPLHVANCIAKYPSGQAAALAATMTQFLTDDHQRDSFSKFLLHVSQGKIRSVFAGYMDPE
jgi:hypothetical protein